MRYRYNSRSAKRLAKKSKRNFIFTIILIIGLMYATLQWVLPSIIGGMGLINNTIKPSKKITPANFNSLAPPVFNIPFEATNTARINITGYTAPSAKITLYLDDEAKDTAQALQDGKFEFKNVSLALGTNNIYGKTIDEKGKESLPSKTLIVVYDNEKPDLSVSEPSDGKEIQGGDKKITIKGKSEPDAKIFINDVRAIINLDGSFSSDQMLNDGDNIFTIRAIDKAGNETAEVRKVIYKP